MYQSIRYYRNIETNLMVPTPRSFATLDPNRTAPSIVLSNGNLTATPGAPSSGNGDNTFTTTSKSSGKKYIEVSIPTFTFDISDIGFGIATAAHGLQGTFLGDASDSFGFFPASATPTHWSIWLNGNIGGGDFDAAYGGAGGIVWGITFDFDNKECWVRPDGGAWSRGGDPNTRSLPIDFSAIDAGPYFFGLNTFHSGEVVTVNLGQSAFLRPVPTGYSSWST